MSIINKLKEEMRETPAGKLLVRYGFEPYDTESNARRVAERAAVDIAELTRALDAEHKAIDLLLAQRIQKDATFLPSKHSVWPTVKAGALVLQEFRPYAGQ